MDRTTQPRSPSSPHRTPAAGDVQAFLLSAALAFLLVVGGGWYLAGQVTLPNDDLLGSEVEQVAGASHARARAAVPATDREEWHFYIYTGAPLHDRERRDLGRAWTRLPRDDG